MTEGEYKMNMGINMSLLLALTAIQFFVFCGCSRPQTEVSSQRAIQQKSKKIDSILQRDIERAPQILLDISVNRGAYIKSVCKRIADIPDAEFRIKCFRELEDRAFSIRFEELDSVSAKDRDEKCEMERRLRWAHHALKSLTDEIWGHLWSQGAPQEEQFEPMFRFYEKMRDESRRIGRNVEGYSSRLDLIERLYGQNLKRSSAPKEEFVPVRERFKKLAGRPPRTEDEYVADLKAKIHQQSQVE